MTPASERRCRFWSSVSFESTLSGADNLLGLFQAQERDRPREAADERADPRYGFRIASLFDLSPVPP